MGSYHDGFAVHCTGSAEGASCIQAEESGGSEPIPAPPVRQKRAAKRSLPAAEQVKLSSMWLSALLLQSCKHRLCCKGLTGS